MDAVEFIKNFADVVNSRGKGNFDLKFVGSLIEYLQSKEYTNEGFFKKVDPYFTFRSYAHAYLLSEVYFPMINIEIGNIFKGYNPSLIKESEQKEDELINKIKNIFSDIVKYADFSYTEHKPGWDEAALSRCVADVESALENIKAKNRYKADKDATSVQRREAYGAVIDEWFREHVEELFDKMKSTPELIISKESRLTPNERRRFAELLEDDGSMCLWTPHGQTPAANLLKKVKAYLSFDDEETRNKLQSLKAECQEQTDKKVFAEDQEFSDGDDGKESEKVEETPADETPENGNVTGS